MAEAIIDPELPIVDPHHHLWFMSDEMIDRMERSKGVLLRGLAPVYRQHQRYAFDELLSDLRSGHNIIATVFVEARAMYRASGPTEFRSLGEVEFANGVAAIGASGMFGPVRPCAGIVGNVDLRLGDRVDEVLLAHIQAAGGRYREFASRRRMTTTNRYSAAQATLMGSWSRSFSAASVGWPRSDSQPTFSYWNRS